MNQTKLKILNTSLVLFNEYGLPKVTLRGIANEMGISQGNLSYHYNKREDIIEHLYFLLVKNIDDSIETILPEEMSIKTMYGICRAMAFQFYRFRFFFLDFAQIMREHKRIREHYNKLSEIRKTQMLFLIKALISKKLLRPEELENEYENLYTRTQILSDFWMSSLSIQTSPISLKTTQQYIKIIFENIYPYLTSNGVTEYQKISF